MVYLILKAVTLQLPRLLINSTLLLSLCKGYLVREEDRPRLLRLNLTEDLLIENIILQDSPYHTLYLDAVNNVEIRNISIIARRTHHDGHGWVDLTAFNTDGIDVSGHNVWIHGTALKVHI